MQPALHETGGGQDLDVHRAGWAHNWSVWCVGGRNSPFFMDVAVPSLFKRSHTRVFSFKGASAAFLELGSIYSSLVLPLLPVPPSGLSLLRHSALGLLPLCTPHTAACYTGGCDCPLQCEPVLLHAFQGQHSSPSYSWSISSAPQCAMTSFSVILFFMFLPPLCIYSCAYA